MPGAHKVPNTNFYRAPEHGDDLEAFGRWAADRIEEAIEFEGPDTVAAVFLEPVQNSGGCFPPPPGYFQRVREICDQHDVLLVSDEVICAFGRLGTTFGCDRFGYQPDIITCAKGMTSGYSPHRRDDRQRPDRRAVPARRRRRSRTATPSAATRCPPRSRWPTSTSSSARTSTSTCWTTRAPSAPTLEKLLRPADRRRRPRRRLLLRHRAGQGQGHQGDLRRRRVRAAAARLPVQGAVRRRALLPGRRPRRPGHPARAAADLRPGAVRRDRADPALACSPRPGPGSDRAARDRRPRTTGPAAAGEAGPRPGGARRRPRRRAGSRTSPSATTTASPTSCRSAYARDGDARALPRLDRRAGCSARWPTAHRPASPSPCSTAWCWRARCSSRRCTTARAMVLGTCAVLDRRRQAGARCERVTEHLMPGRWADARQPNRKELAATLVLSLPLDEWSVKVSDGPPDDADEDLDLPVWAGVAAAARDRRRAGRRHRTSRRAPAAGVRRDVDRSVTRATALPRACRSGTTPPATTGRHGRALPRRPRRRRRDRRRRLHRAVDGLLPGQRPTRRCASSCSSARSPASAPAGATAAGARRCSPRRWPGWPRGYGARARPSPCTARCRRPSTRSAQVVGRRGHRLRLRQGRHRRRSPARRVQLDRARAEVGRGASVGLRRGRPRAARRRRGPRRGSAATDVLGATYTPHCAADPPGPAGARAGPRRRAPRRDDLTSTRR